MWRQHPTSRAVPYRICGAVNFYPMRQDRYNEDEREISAVVRGGCGVWVSVLRCVMRSAASCADFTKGEPIGLWGVARLDTGLAIDAYIGLAAGVVSAHRRSSSARAASVLA